MKTPPSLRSVLVAGAVLVGVAAIGASILMAQAPAGGVRGLPPVPPKAEPRDEALAADAVRQLVEADWLRQAEAWNVKPAARPVKGKPKQPATPTSLLAAAPAAAPLAAPATGTAFPTADFIDRGRKLAAELRGTFGADTAAAEREMDTLARELEGLKADAAADVQKALYFKVRRAVRRLAFSNPLVKFDKLLFMKRFTQETYPDICLNHMPWVSRPGGDICVLSNPFSADGNGQGVRHVLNNALGAGHVHGMDLWWDGSRVVFGYARSRTGQPPAGFPRRMGHAVRLSEEPTHIFEVNIDGGNLRQLTDHEMWSDLDPTYLPSGNICFVSDRCGYSLQCNEWDKDETSTNLYVMKPDGGEMRRMSVTKDGDYLPHTLDDGQVAYTRWEYQERGWAPIQSIWTIRPDGTWADALFKQHMNAPWALEETRSIPGSHKLVAIATGHHTLPIGPVCVIDPHVGMNDASGISIVTPGAKNPEGPMAGTAVAEGGVRDAGGYYSHPWALGDAASGAGAGKFFLCCYSFSNVQTDRTGFGVYLIDVFGNKELIFRDATISSFEPIPLRARPRPQVLPEMIDLKKDYAVCSVSRANDGVDGVDAGRARYLRVSQGLGWPYDKEHGGFRYERDAKGMGLNWNPVRVLGTVPLDANGKALFRVPADQSMYFQLLDANYQELRRMRSFISFQPGEVRACVGCHETKAIAATMVEAEPFGRAKAPADITPPPWGGDTFNFLRHVQPVLDKHCLGCHGGINPAGGLSLHGGLTANHNVAYDNLIDRKRALLAICDKNSNADITRPMQYGSHASKLTKLLRGEAHAKRAQLTQKDWLRLVTWMDINCVYHDKFWNKRPAKPAYDLAADRALAGQIAAAQQKCTSCHKAADVSRLDLIDVREPARSLFLLAPLAKSAGGSGKCVAKDAPGGAAAPYADKADADYQAVLKLVQDAVKKAVESPRRDLEWMAGPARPSWSPASPPSIAPLRSH